MVVVVPATTATAVPFDIHVNVSLDVDIVDAGAADIVGARVSPAIVNLHALPGATTGSGASAATSTTPATTPTAANGGPSERGHGEARQNEGGQRCQKQFAQ
jgi:hypothetical protein